MKKLSLIIIALPLLFSCSKNEGCNDPKAFNYSTEVDYDDGSCTYSKLVFYADSTQYPGTPIDHIEILINGNSIGAFVGASYGVLNCTASGAKTSSYDLSSSIQVEWTAAVHLTNGSDFNNTGTISSDLTQQCMLINVLQ
ncbi:MAG: hypothetical protein JKX68_04595 [Flavobacteriales bacterium]|nr:hypothetical protein [Flavobacteriales bacterium]